MVCDQILRRTFLESEKKFDFWYKFYPVIFGFIELKIFTHFIARPRTIRTRSSFLFLSRNLNFDLFCFYRFLDKNGVCLCPEQAHSSLFTRKMILHDVVQGTLELRQSSNQQGSLKPKKHNKIW